MASGTIAQPDIKRTDEPSPSLAIGLLVALCAVKFVLHALTSLHRYGYFRDELYLLDCGRHLYWGYVDMAPLSAVYARVALLLGGSLPALRIMPALAGTALIALPSSSLASWAAAVLRNFSPASASCLFP
jgi:hypothetical protein